MKTTDRIRTFILFLTILVTIAAVALTDTLRLPEGVKTIEEETFMGDNNLDEVVLPEGIESIGSRAFADSSVKTINLPSTLTSIADDAFYGVTGLVATAETGTVAYEWAVEQGYILETAASPLSDFTIIVNETTKQAIITGYKYRMSDGPEVVLLPTHTQDGYPITAIGESAFEESYSLTTLIVPEGYTSIGSEAFMNCSSLKSVSILSSKMNSIGASAFYNCRSLETFTASNGLKSIGDYVFKYCSSLKNINLPDTLVSLGRAFEQCTSLMEISIPSSLKVLKGYTFWECDSLEIIQLHDGLETIKGFAIDSCNSLKSLVLPDSVHTIGSYAINNCSQFTSINFPRNWTERDADDFDQTAIINGCPLFTSITIPEGVTTIPKAAFSGCTSLKEVRLPSTVTGFESYITPDFHPFANCSGLEIIHFPDTFVTLPSYSLQRCGFTYFAVPDNLEVFYPTTLSQCTSLRELYIPQNVDVRIDSVYGLSDVTVYGYPGSSAENYAAYNEFTFIDVTVTPWPHGDEGTLEQQVTVSGTVTSHNGMPIEGVYVILQNNEMGDFRSEVTGYDGRWSINAVKDRIYEVSYSSFDYVVTGTATSIIAIDKLSLTATAVIEAEISNGISFSMKQDKKDVTEIVVGSSVDFTATAPEEATRVRLIVDGIAYEEYSLTDHQAAFSREFSSSGPLESGERQIQMQIFVKGEWTKLSAAKTLTVNSNGNLDVPEDIHLENGTNKHVINTPLTVYWKKVTNASSYTVYVYCGGLRVWPKYGREIADARTPNLSFEIPAEAFPIADDHYTIQIVTSSVVIDDKVGFNSSTGTLEPIIVKNMENEAEPLKLESVKFGRSFSHYVDINSTETITLTTSPNVSTISIYIDDTITPFLTLETADSELNSDSTSRIFTKDLPQKFTEGYYKYKITLSDTDNNCSTIDNWISTYSGHLPGITMYPAKMGVYVRTKPGDTGRNGWQLYYAQNVDVLGTYGSNYYFVSIGEAHAIEGYVKKDELSPTCAQSEWDLVNLEIVSWPFFGSTATWPILEKPYSLTVKWDLDYILPENMSFIVKLYDEEHDLILPLHYSRLTDTSLTFSSELLEPLVRSNNNVGVRLTVDIYNIDTDQTVKSAISDDMRRLVKADSDTDLIDYLKKTVESTIALHDVFHHGYYIYDGKMYRDDSLQAGALLSSVYTLAVGNVDQLDLLPSQQGALIAAEVMSRESSGKVPPILNLKQFEKILELIGFEETVIEQVVDSTIAKLRATNLVDIDSGDFGINLDRFSKQIGEALSEKVSLSQFQAVFEDVSFAVDAISMTMNILKDYYEYRSVTKTSVQPFIDAFSRSDAPLSLHYAAAALKIMTSSDSDLGIYLATTYGSAFAAKRVKDAVIDGTIIKLGGALGVKYMIMTKGVQVIGNLLANAEEVFSALYDLEASVFQLNIYRNDLTDIYETMIESDTPIDHYENFILCLDRMISMTSLEIEAYNRFTEAMNEGAMQSIIKGIVYLVTGKDQSGIIDCDVYVEQMKTGAHSICNMYHDFYIAPYRQ